NLLYLVLGLLLSLIVASGVLSEYCVRDVKVRRLLPDAAHAAEPFALRYELTRSKGFCFALSVRELAAGLTGSAFAPVVRACAPRALAEERDVREAAQGRARARGAAAVRARHRSEAAGRGTGCALRGARSADAAAARARPRGGARRRRAPHSPRRRAWA